MGTSRSSPRITSDTFDFDDPNFEHRPYDRWLGYGQSKTANILFAVGLDRRGQTHGIRAFAVHPGVIWTIVMPYAIDPDGAERLWTLSERLTAAG